jgi:hypothetical protein
MESPQKGGDLVYSRTAKQPEVSRNDTKLPLAEVKLRNERSARLAPRQPQARTPVGYRMFPDEQRVAAPTKTVRDVRLRQKPHSGFTLNRNWIEKPAAAAETTIDLLEGDDVSAEFVDHRHRAVGAGEAVDAPALVDVVGRDLHGNLDSESSQI